MKKIFISIITVIFLSVCCISTACAKEETEPPLGIDINGGVSLGNTNANISLGGYMAASKEKSDQQTFYSYVNPSFLYDGTGSRIGEKQGLIKAGNGFLYLSYGFNCKNINNYNDEWIFFMKNNDGCIYKVKTDGTNESKLELPFFVKSFLLVNDRLIIETQFCEYGKIMSADLNGNDLRLIAKCDPRCGNMMIQADEKGVYYYDDVNLELKRISYDGKEEILIFKGVELSGAPVLLFQVCNNKIIIRTYDIDNKKRSLLLDLNKPIVNIEEINEYIAKSSSNLSNTGLPFFEYQSIYILDDNCFNFSDDGCFVLSSVKPENYILGYDEWSSLPSRNYVYKLDLNCIDKINNGTNDDNRIIKWKDEVFYEGYVDIIGGSNRDYAVYVTNGEVSLYDPVRYLNLLGLRFFSDYQISYREPNYREPNKNQ